MQHKRAMQYNSSISQAFMVMSFAAAGLLMSVQLVGGGDRSSSSGRQAYASIDPAPTYEIVPSNVSTNAVVPQPVDANRVDAKPVAPNRDEDTFNPPLSLEGNIGWHSSEESAAQRQTNTPGIQESGLQASLAPWRWVFQPILYPMRVVSDRLADSSYGHSDQEAEIKEGTQAIASLPSPPNSVSQVVSQARVDSTPSSSFNQQAQSESQTSQTEHTPTEHFGQEENRDRPLSPAPSLAVTEQQPAPSSSQPSHQLNPIKQDSTNQAITTQGQTDQNNIQQEHPTARLVVDLSDRQLALYQHDEEVQTYPIAVGKAGWETPLGEFTVTDKDPSPLWQHPLTGELVPAGANSPLGSRWIGFWSDGIHQIGFHGTNQSQSIGQAISHGCIRLHDADIQALYTQVALGTPVIVQP